MFTAPLLSRHFSANLGAELIKVGAQYGIGATVAEIDRGLPAEVVQLSQDGRHWIDGWHTGPETGEAVYVESHVRGGRSFHGWVDSASRRIVQTG